MIKRQIEELKEELNHLIDKGYDFTEVYELSVRLDELITQYYNKNNING